MKSTTLVLVGLAIASVTVRGQITLDAGETFYYGFNSLPRVQTAVPGGGQFGQVGLGFASSSLDPLDSFAVEIFETDATGAPLASAQGSGASAFLSCSAGGAWQDLQGGMRLSIASGSVTLNSIDFVVVTPAAPGLINVYQGTFTPVPEPGMIPVLGVGAMCVWLARRRMKANAA